MNGAAFLSASDSNQMSEPVFGSCAPNTMYLSSEDHDIGATARSDSKSSSSVPDPSEGFRYSPGLPLRVELNTMRSPVGDQIGLALCCEASHVRRNSAPVGS